MKGKMLLIQSEGLGRGDDRLGSLLMGNFLRQLGQSENRPAGLIFWNTGVRLVCEGSGVLEPLRSLEAQGVEIMVCSTCLEYFDLADTLAVGRTTTMQKSIHLMLGYDVVGL